MRPTRSLALTTLTAGAVVGVLSLSASLAGAAPAPATGHYAAYTANGSSGAWTGSVTVDAAGFPAGALTSTSSSVSVPSGASAFLGPDTPFGKVFGSSRGLPYLSADTAAGKAASTTTVKFDSPTPAGGWGFTLGDIDADSVAITATDASGAPLTGTALADALGEQGAFNFCAVSPKPSSCAGPGPFTDVPTWDPTTATLTGNIANTSGASDWFRPTVALGSITFTFSVLSGIPNYQIWLASLAVPVSGSVDGVTADTPGVAVDLLDKQGDPVTDPAGDPVTAPVESNGDFTLPAVVDGDYQLKIDPTPKVRPTGPTTVPLTVDVADGAVTLPAGTFAVVPVAAPTSSAPPSSSTPPSASSSANAGPAAGPSASPIAATGPDTRGLSVLAAALIGLGTIVLFAARGLPRRRH